MATPETNSPQDRLLDHSYDGIQEYDNPMPRWWLLTFAGTVVFSVIYLFNIGPVGNGKGRIADYEAEMTAFDAAHPQPTAADVPTDRLIALGGNRAALEEGKQLFATYCAVCHRPDAGGLIGPNLTDAYWIHGGAIGDIYTTVMGGVLDKGMPPWSRTLKPEQVEAVVAYVASLKGSNPSNPKAPQGELISP